MGKINKVSFAHQASLLKSRFPNSKVNVERDQKITWEATLQPTPLSNIYRVKVIYAKDQYPKSFVVNPKPLKLVKGENVLPHVYNTNKQQLCLFYPDGKEWNTSKLLVRTIVPWISEWLYYYELWLGTGEWLGGGTKHKKSNK